MGALLESGMVGNIGLKHLRVIKEDTIKKWDDLGFLEGLEGHQKDNIAQLYENQASYLINEAAVADASGSFETVVFPIIRRVFSKLLANDIVSVQAMNLPIGKLFYFVPQIQGYTGATADSYIPGGNSDSGQHYAPIGSPGNYGGDPNAGYPNNSNAYTKNLYDLFYEGTEPGLDPAGLFDYSKGRFIVMTSATATQVWNGSSLTTSAYTSTGVAQPSATVEYRKILVAMTGFTSTGAGKLIGPDGQEMDTESFLSDLHIVPGAGLADVESDCLNLTGTPTSLPFRVVTQQYGKGIVQYGQTTDATWPNYGNNGKFYDVCTPDGVIYLEVDLQCPVCATCSADTLDGYHASAFQMALTNPVTGTGTLNYVAKFGSSSTIENSQIYDNGFQVGIGLTNPSAKFHVNGLSILTNPNGDNYNENIRLPQASGGYASIALGGAVASLGTSIQQWTILKNPSNNFMIRHYNTDHLFINTDGNVGLGTTNPNQKLDVAGNIYANGGFVISVLSLSISIAQPFEWKLEFDPPIFAFNAADL